MAFLTLSCTRSGGARICGILITFKTRGSRPSVRSPSRNEPPGPEMNENPSVIEGGKLGERPPPVAWWPEQVLQAPELD